MILLVLVLARLPLFMRLRFYPSFAAMTFPFVITATALGKALAFLRASGVALPAVLDWLLVVEMLLACAMVAFVVVHYLRFFARSLDNPDDASVRREGKLASLIARGLRP